ncbi:DUF6531 domain-containing protein, partial [Sphingomonas sp. NCPPB 2930]
GGRCGLFGYGWTTPLDISIALESGAAKLHDSRGRTITFDEPLLPGHTLYSRSENLWLLRGGIPQYVWERGEIAPRWQSLPEHWRRDPRAVFATSGDDRTVFCFGPWDLGAPASAPSPVAASTGTDGATAEQPARHLVLHLILDRYGRTQRMLRDPHGQLAGVEDPLGRRYEFQVEQLYPARPGSSASGASAAPAAPGQPFWQADSGQRLTAVYLRSDPHNPNHRGGGSTLHRDFG